MIINYTLMKGYKKSRPQREQDGFNHRYKVGCWAKDRIADRKTIQQL
jgi:hypothetical protein